MASDNVLIIRELTKKPDFALFLCYRNLCDFVQILQFVGILGLLICEIAILYIISEPLL